MGLSAGPQIVPSQTQETPVTPAEHCSCWVWLELGCTEQLKIKPLLPQILEHKSSVYI